MSGLSGERVFIDVTCAFLGGVLVSFGVRGVLPFGYQTMIGALKMSQTFTPCEEEPMGFPCCAMIKKVAGVSNCIRYLV